MTGLFPVNSLYKNTQPGRSVPGAFWTTDSTPATAAMPERAEPTFVRPRHPRGRTTYWARQHLGPAEGAHDHRFVTGAQLAM